jgi:hypothetical protein
MADFSPKPGQNIFRDVTTDPITGKPHKVKVCGPWLQFDEDAPIELDEPGMFVRLSVVAGLKKALVMGHDSDEAYLLDEGIAAGFGRVMGLYPFAFTLSGSPVFQRDNSRPDFASEGIHHIEPGNKWVMNNDTGLNRSIEWMRPPDMLPETVDLIQIDETREWLVGKCDAAVNSGVARYNRVTGVLEHVPLYTQMPPFVNAQGWVAIQGSEWKMTPEPDAVPWIRHEDLPSQPPMPNPDPPPVDPPKPVDCTAERERIASLEAELREVLEERDDAYELGEKDRRERDEAIRTRLTPEQVIKLVNDATGQMAGYWRYLGVQGAVDRAVKAELAKRKT